MLRCLKWFPVVFVAVFAVFGALSFMLFRHRSIQGSDTNVQITVKAYDATTGEPITAIIYHPKDKKKLPTPWRESDPPGYRLTVAIRPVKEIYGGTRNETIVWFTDKEYREWHDHRLLTEMENFGADANAQKKVSDAVESQHKPGTRNYDYAIIFKSVTSKK